MRHEESAPNGPGDLAGHAVLYEAYVKFEKEYAEFLRTNRHLRWQRREFGDLLTVLDKMDFLAEFSSLPPLEKKGTREKWLMGFEEWMRQERGRFEQLLWRISQFGLPEHLQRKAEQNPFYRKRAA